MKVFGGRIRAALSRIESHRSGRRFLVSLTGVLLALSCVPILVLGVFVFSSTTGAIERQIIDSSARYLIQTVNAFEIIRAQLEDSFKRLVLDDTIHSFETAVQSAPDGKSASNEEWRDYLNLRNGVFDKLGSLHLSSRFIDSVYYYSGSLNCLLTSDWLQYPFASFHDSSWIDQLPLLNEKPYVWFPREAHSQSGAARRVISVIFRSLAEKNVIVVNISATQLYDTVIRRIDFSPSSRMSVALAGGEPILYDPSRPKPASESAQQGARTAGEVAYTLDRTNKLLSMRLFDSGLDWVFRNENDLGALYGKLQQFQLLYVLGTSIMLLLGIAVSLQSGRVLYRPIRHILGVARQFLPAAMPGTGSRKDELDLIEEFVEAAVEHRSRLQKQLSESLPGFRDSLLHSLSTDPASIGPTTLPRLELAGIRLRPEGFMALAVQLDDVDDGSQHSSVKARVRAQIVNAVQSLLDCEWGAVCEFDPGRYGIILSGDSTELSRAFELAQRIQEAIGETSGLRCSIGVGAPQAFMKGIAQSHQEALEALKYRLVPGGGQIIYLNDMRFSEVPKLIFPHDKAEVMSGYLKSGDSVRAVAMLREIVDPAAADAGVQNYQLQSLFVRLIGVIVDSMQELGIEWSLIFPQLRSPFDILMSMDSTQGLVDWCAKVIVKVAEYTQTSRESRTNGHVERARRIVEGEFDLNLNQTIVAERMGLNPFYLGRIFKEQTGTSFLDYLTEVRTERARRLLRETVLSVSEIASKVGYGDERYFIRVFKSRTGATPGRYRQLHM